MTKRVALCVPSFQWQSADPSAIWHYTPYALCLLAASVRDFCDIDIIDANLNKMSLDDTVSALKNGKYDLVGVTVMTDQFAIAAHQFTKAIRDALPDISIVLGGVYPTIYPDKVMEDPAVTFAVIGEGEEVFRQLLQFLWNGEPMPDRGLGFRDETGAVHLQERASFIKNLDALPLPAYDLLDFSKYSTLATREAVDSPVLFPFAHILTSRGCPQGCCFCQVKHISGNRFRPRSAAKILDEIAWLKDMYGVRSLLFDDDNIVTQRSRATAIFQGMIDRGLDMPWKALAMAVFKLDEPLIELMARSGCKYFCIAIESGSPRVLKDVIQKPVNLEHAKRMVAFAKSCGIFVAANFIIGFPTETWDEIRETIHAAEDLDVDYAKIFTAIPLRFTRLWDMCEQENAFKKDFDPIHISWNVGQIHSPHFHEQELTMLRAYEWDRINFATQEKREKLALTMNISLERLEQGRVETRKLALSRLMGHAHE